MKKMLDLDALAGVMRRNSGEWMMLDEDGGYRGALSSRASSWKSRPPAAFASGRFRFRVRYDRAESRFVLWGMHEPASFPLTLDE